ncbi:MAG: BatA and WFA domain-containing protein [Bacteroidales bacterium]|nr:BatA and WFA domain-containing protein [Bacteroidales bacterium]MBR6227749.1 BatA and WFA domain-containing protein [Bacteroidales bacterium]
MRFLYPNMLWGLFALLIPILIHLFNFRRHKLVYFSNTAVLRSIQQENAKTRKLKYLVTLLLRCLFIAALVLAFAFPYHPEKQLNVNIENNLVGVYIDNSMSMKGQSQRTTLIEDARQSARDLVHKLNPSNRYLLMTNSFEIQNEYPMNQEEMLDQLDRMNPDGAPAPMGEVVDRFEMLAKQHGFETSTLFVYSDFQSNTFDLSAAKADTAMQVVVVPMTPEFKTNLYVDSVWLASPVVQPGLTNDLYVRIVNQGDKEVKGLPVTFTMNGAMAASTTVDLEKNGTQDIVMQFVVEGSGDQRCSVSLNDHPIIFDDAYDFVLGVRPSLSVIELGSEATSCALLFDDDEQFRYTLMEPSRFDLDQLSKAQFIIVNENTNLNETLQQTLLNCVTDGAAMLVFPSKNDPKNNAFLMSKLGLTVMELDTNATVAQDLALRHEFFSDVILDMPQQADLPKVKKHVRMRSNGIPSSLLILQNGDPMLYSETVGQGQAFVMTTALDSKWSDLADHSLFVPMMVKMALLGGQLGKLSYTIGQDKIMVLNDMNLEGDHRFLFANADRSFEQMPASEVRNGKVYLYLNDNLPAAGFYDLLVNDTLNRVTAWNESRVESRMDFVDRDDIEAQFKKAGFDVAAVLDTSDFANADLVEAMAHQSSQWKLFALIALLALLGEILVLRFWK